jgi:hypothetical protein
MPREDIERKYPFPSYTVEPNEAKLQTLEYFVLTPGWHSAEEVRNDSLASGWESAAPESRSVKMRLLRYSRMGLLAKMKVGRKWEYSVTTRGEERLLHLWRAGGLLDPHKTNTNLEREEIATRLEVEQIVLDREERELRRIELAYQ